MNCLTEKYQAYGGKKSAFVVGPLLFDFKEFVITVAEKDGYCDNLAVPFVSLTIGRLIIVVAYFFFTVFLMIPIAFVPSLADIDGIVKAAHFLQGIMEVKFVKFFIQGVLPRIALKIFLIIIPPSILMIMSKLKD